MESESNSLKKKDEYLKVRMIHVHCVITISRHETEAHFLVFAFYKCILSYLLCIRSTCFQFLKWNLLHKNTNKS